MHDDVLVLSADGKGIVMRPDSLRPPTAKAAATATTKLTTRLSKGEKRNRKRLAEVGAVYDLAPVPRQATDVLASRRRRRRRTPDPPTRRRRPRTSGSPPASSTTPHRSIAGIFDEAERRDPDQRRTWVALVDGNNHQIDRIQAEARPRGSSSPS